MVATLAGYPIVSRTSMAVNVYHSIPFVASNDIFKGVNRLIGTLSADLAHTHTYSAGHVHMYAVNIDVAIMSH